MPQPKVSIIIVNWNGLSVTDECLQSLEKLDYPNFNITLVDNGSSDGSVAFFKKHHPKADVIALKTNTGFTGGNNTGIRKALKEKADYVLLLNNDTIVSEPAFLSKMIEACEANSRIGMACPTIFYDSPADKVWYAGAWLSLWKGWGHYYQVPKHDKIITTGYATGCCLLVQTQTIRDIGLLNDAYFLSVEDVEWSMRAKQNGWETVYIPGVSIIHKDSVSSRSDNKGKFSSTRVYCGFRNSIWFVREYATMFQKVSVWSFRFGFRYLYKITAYLFLGRWQKAQAITRGLKDGLFSDLYSQTIDKLR